MRAWCLALFVLMNPTGSFADAASPEEGYDKAKRDCEQGNPDACALMGVHVQNGKGVTRNLNRASKLFERACNAGSQVGCTDLAALYVSGEERPQNLAFAQQLYEKACKAKVGRACSAVAFLLRQDPKDDGKTRKAKDFLSFANRGCVLKNGWGCYLLGTDALERANEPKAARTHYAQSCEYGHGPGCILLGQLHVSGKGGPTNSMRGAELFYRACDLGQPKGCGHLGRLTQAGLGVAKSPDKAAKLFKVACEAGDERSCTDLGMACIKGVGLPLNYSCAKKRFKQACDAGDARGCTNFGLMAYRGLKQRKNIRKALRYYEKACGMGDEKSCGFVGLVYLDELSTIPGSAGLAQQALTRSCQAGHAFACDALASDR
jgi:TPR repeat protein